MCQKRPWIYAGVLLSILIAATNFAAIARAHTELILSDTRPRRGEVVRLVVQGDSTCEYSARFRDHNLPFFERSGQIQALVGIPLEGDTGPELISFTSRACGDQNAHTLTLKLAVREGNYPVQHLSIEDTSKVQLSDTDLQRHYREARSIRRALSRHTAKRRWSFPFHFPLENGQAGNSFGSRRVINGNPRSPHSGEDYDAAAGETVYSINRGVVSLVGNFFFSGKSVFLDHGQGLHSMYFHLSSIDVSEGQTVRKGEAIGKVGSTGRVTGPHLHLGIRLNGARVDPDWFFQSDNFQ